MFSRVTWSISGTIVLFPCCLHFPKIFKKMIVVRKAEIKNSMEPCKGNHDLSILVSTFPMSTIVFSPPGGQLWFVTDFLCVHSGVLLFSCASSIESPQQNHASHRLLKGHLFSFLYNNASIPSNSCLCQSFFSLCLLFFFLSFPGSLIPFLVVKFVDLVKLMYSVVT